MTLNGKLSINLCPDCTDNGLVTVESSIDSEQTNETHMWQSRVEIEGYSVAYFDRIVAFKARRTAELPLRVGLICTL